MFEVEKVLMLFLAQAVDGNLDFNLLEGLADIRLVEGGGIRPKYFCFKFCHDVPTGSEEEGVGVVDRLSGTLQYLDS